MSFVKIFLFINSFFLISCSSFYLASFSDLFLKRKIPSYFSYPMSCPIKTSKSLSQNFRPSYNLKHEGLDFPLRKGSPIYASHSGKVVLSTYKKAYGKTIIIEYDKYWASLYAHLSKIFVKKGDFVKAGKKIALSGNTGRSTGPHLHFEVIHNKQVLNPLYKLSDTCFKLKK